MLVVLLLVSRVDDQATAIEVITAMTTYLSPNASELVTNTVRKRPRRPASPVLGVGVLLWGHQDFPEPRRGLLRHLRRHEREGSGRLLHGRRRRAAGGRSRPRRCGDHRVGDHLRRRAGGQPPRHGRLDGQPRHRLLPLFYLFPDEDVTVREVLPGDGAGGRRLDGPGVPLSLLRRRRQRRRALRRSGTVILLLTWLYFSGFVLLLGAALNAVLAGRSADTAEAGWGENRDAKERAPFTDPLRRIERGLAAKEPFSVSIDGGGRPAHAGRERGHCVGAGPS